MYKRSSISNNFLSRYLFKKKIDSDDDSLQINYIISEQFRNHLKPQKKITFYKFSLGTFERWLMLVLDPYLSQVSCKCSKEDDGTWHNWAHWKVRKRAAKREKWLGKIDLSASPLKWKLLFSPSCLLTRRTCNFKINSKPPWQYGNLINWNDYNHPHITNDNSIISVDINQRRR